MLKALTKDPADRYQTRRRDARRHRSGPGRPAGRRPAGVDDRGDPADATRSGGRPAAATTTLPRPADDDEPPPAAAGGSGATPLLAVAVAGVFALAAFVGSQLLDDAPTPRPCRCPRSCRADRGRGPRRRCRRDGLHRRHGDHRRPTTVPEGNVSSRTRRPARRGRPGQDHGHAHRRRRRPGHRDGAHAGRALARRGHPGRCEDAGLASWARSRRPTRPSPRTRCSSAAPARARSSRPAPRSTSRWPAATSRSPTSPADRGGPGRADADRRRVHAAHDHPGRRRQPARHGARTRPRRPTQSRPLRLGGHDHRVVGPADDVTDSRPRPTSPPPTETDVPAADRDDLPPPTQRADGGHRRRPA